MNKEKRQNKEWEIRKEEAWCFDFGICPKCGVKIVNTRHTFMTRNTS